ncbi:MAG: hypothetical protein G8D61_14925, partial [gamma proteobacterium symbiont of Ctena orbiculata]
MSYSVSQLPYWLDFSAATRSLSGQPTWADLGNSYPVVISVDDGESSIENRFTITVTEPRPVTD